MSESSGLLFPGQGAQYVGMGADLYERYDEARETYDRATDLLELDIRRISFEGPEEELRQTRFTQPAILVHSLAVLAALPDRSAAAAAGHSLGEYPALFAAGVLDFDSVVKLVKRRAALMGDEGEKNPGTMAAIIGLESEDVEKLCDEVDGTVVPANYNEPLQTVVSGEIEAVKRVAELASEQGARKAVMLPVSGAFHSPLLTESAASFADFIEGFEFREPSCPVIVNVTGRIAGSATELKSSLTKQLISPVRWVDTMAEAVRLDIGTFLEPGPGRVLTGLARRINRSLKVTPVGTADQVEALRSD